MNISVICPLYKAGKYIDNLHDSLLMQKEVNISEIKYVLTNTGDGLENKIEKLEKAKISIVEPKYFSHSLVREKAALESDADIFVFITQDIIIKDEFWLKKFITPIAEGKCEAAYCRQICDNLSIERYTRIKNYPEESRIVTKKDTEELGIKTFFFSDAASAVSAKIYRELNAYDGKDLLTNEDMYFAYKLINSGYRKMYNAEASVIHSHDYKFKELFKRYFDQGVFLKDNNYLTKFNANSSAKALLLFIVKESIREKNFKAISNIIPNFAARYLGNILGQNYNKLSNKTIKKLTAGKAYWDRKNNN